MAGADTASKLPGVKHKVIGLVSGGKDSCFNMMHTVANGHEIVALATLTPEPGVDEIDSHMYQSVGTTIPPLIAEAMGLPHYTHVIKGGAVEQGAEYGSREHGGEGSGQEGDETEDLTALLKTIMADHPDVTAISSGAILSNYQRLRIEHVCQRLGLTSLAYLWQSEQLPLVNKMVSSGLEAVLVKVAGIGLGQRQVGKSLGQLLPLLTRLQMQFGAHPAGEGGEYETLTVDCPLFNSRINFIESEIIESEPEPFPVAYLRIAKAELQPKEGWVKPSVTELRELLELDTDEVGREGLDEKSLEVLDAVGSVKTKEVDVSSVAGQLDCTTLSTVGAPPAGVRFGRHGRWFAVSAEGQSAGASSVKEEVAAAFDMITARLREETLSLPLHATHITLLLSSMDLFPGANAAYVQYFGTSPPSRACVAVPLPEGERIRVEVIGFDDQAEDAPVGGRTALHVQGLSYWAPANIGPYSQAVTVNSRLHIAGQIPLQPPSLTFAPYPPAPASPYPHQAALALQHVGRIIDVLRNPNSTGGGWTGWVESCVCWWAQPRGHGTEGPEVARQAWKAWAEENDCTGAPAIFVQAKELPRGALVEYQVNVHTGRPGCEAASVPAAGGDDSDDDSDDEDPSPACSHTETPAAYREECKAPASRHGSRRAIFLNNEADLKQISMMLTSGKDVVSAKMYHAPSASSKLLTLATSTLEHFGIPTVGVPVLGVQNVNGQLFAVAFELFGA